LALLPGVAKGIRSSTLNKLRKVLGHISAAKSVFDRSVSGESATLNEEIDPINDPDNEIIR
jgi:hypothetical protein